MIAYRFDESVTPAMPIVDVTIATLDGACEAKLVGLIDTGAEATTIPEFLVAAIDLLPLDRISITGFAGISTTVPSDLAAVTIRGLDTHHIKVVAASEPIVLIGRDILNHYCLLLDAPNGVFEIGHSN